MNCGELLRIETSSVVDHLDLKVLSFVIKGSQKSHRLAIAVLEGVLDQVEEHELHLALISDDLRRQLFKASVTHHSDDRVWVQRCRHSVQRQL